MMMLGAFVCCIRGLGVATPRCSLLGHAIVSRDEVEVLGVEPPANPFKHAVMLVMIGITDRLDELRIAWVSADVFWGAGALSGDDAWVSRSRLSIGHGFKHDVVLPAIAEIVFIDQTVLRMFK